MKTILLMIMTPLLLISVGVVVWLIIWKDIDRLGWLIPALLVVYLIIGRLVTGKG